MGLYATWVEEAAAADRSEWANVMWRRLIAAAVRRLPIGPSHQKRWTGETPFLSGALAQAQSRAPAPLPDSPRIVHLIGTLGAGGAERQLCNCVIGLRQRGYDASVILMFEPVGDQGHYYDLLVEAGVPVILAGASFNPGFSAAVAKVPGGARSVHQLPQECRPIILDVLGELLVGRPDIFHGWLDSSNVWGGIAATLAGIPRIVLSTRNVNPSHFPSIAAPYLQPAYRALMRNPSVQLINNSHAGAADYAAWLGIPPERISVVLNGLDMSRLQRASENEIAAFRTGLGIAPTAPIVAGVFRFSEEKQPLTFLETVRAVVAQCSAAVAVIAGIGALEPEMRQFVSVNGLDRNVVFLGRQSDLTALYSAATVTLLCSRKEGTPNVLLESQWLGCPVVSTRAGGAVDAVADGTTGYLVDVGDVDGLQKAVLGLLRDPAHRHALAANGPGFIQSRFSVDNMVTDTLKAYGIHS
jgi:glycosyltransferase involved in cell wall biosynthesis